MGKYGVVNELKHILTTLILIMIIIILITHIIIVIYNTYHTTKRPVGQELGWESTGWVHTFGNVFY